MLDNSVERFLGQHICAVLRGFNAVGGYAVPPAVYSEFDRMFEENQRDVQLLDIMNNAALLQRLWIKISQKLLQTQTRVAYEHPYPRKPP